MSLIHDDTLACVECGHNKFRAEEQFIFHRTVRERPYPTDKEKPLPHLAKMIVYKCAKCGFELDK
jgi:DNA-directed RNA polymerase subunit RPC12/RpoP